MKRPEKRQKFSASFRITEKDEDIANWLNDLRAQKIPLAKVVSAVLVAYDRGEVICIGSPSQIKSHQSNQNSIFGAETVLSGFGDANVYFERRSRDGWGKRGYNDEYIVGSVPVFTIRNRNAIAAMEEIKQNGDNISFVLKYAIRECWEAYPDSTLPDMEALDRLLSPRKTLRKPSYDADIEDTQMKTPKQDETAREKPVQEHKAAERSASEKWRNPLLDLI